MDKKKITVLINTLNEQDNIADCIKSVSWADEILVVDMHSDDKTRNIAEKLGARVLLHRRVGYVEPARNYGIKKAKNNWVFVVDADERIPAELGKEVENIVANDKCDVCWIAEKNIIFGQWIKHGLLWPDYHPRLFKKGHLAWSNNVHDIPKPKGKELYLDANENNAIEHYSRSYSTVTGFVESYNRYSIFEADTLNSTKYKFRRRHYILIPFREFKLRFFTHEGYKDGHHGLRLAILFAFYKFLVLAKYVEKYQPRVPHDSDRSKWRYFYDLVRDK